MLPKAPLLGCTPAPRCVFTVSSLYAHLCPDFLFHKDTCHGGSEPMLMTSSEVDDLPPNTVTIRGTGAQDFSV